MAEAHIEKGLITSIKPLIFFTRTVGLMPIRFEKIPIQSKLLKLYNILFIIFTTVLFGFLIEHRVVLPKTYERFYHYNDTFLLLFGYLSLLSTIGFLILKTNLIIETILKLAEVDVLLRGIKAQGNPRDTLLYFAKSVGLSFLLITIVLCCDLTTNEHKEPELLLMNIFLYIVYAYAFVNIIEFNCFIYILTQRIKIINQVLINEIWGMQELKSGSTWISQVYPKKSKQITHVSKKNETELGEVVQTIQDVHFKLIEINRLINTFFSAQILITSILTFVELTVNLYYLIKRSLDENGPEKLKFDVRRPTIWFVFNVLITLGFVLPCVWAGHHVSFSSVSLKNFL